PAWIDGLSASGLMACSTKVHGMRALPDAGHAAAGAPRTEAVRRLKDWHLFRDCLEHPGEVAILICRRPLLQDKPGILTANLHGVRLAPAPGFGMAVGEGEGAAVIVPGGREADPGELRCAEDPPLDG